MSRCCCESEHQRKSRIKTYRALEAIGTAFAAKPNRVRDRFCLLPLRCPVTNRYYWLRSVVVEEHPEYRGMIAAHGGMLLDLRWKTVRVILS